MILHPIFLIFAITQLPRVTEESYSTKWIYNLASRYNQSGEKGLGDRRHQNQGNKSMLDDVQLANFVAKITNTTVPMVVYGIVAPVA